MHITFAPRGILQIDNARIKYRNFAGVGDKFNREGDRNFALIIDEGTIGTDPTVRSAEEIRDILRKDVNKYGAGWNVKTKEFDDRDPSIYMTVKIKFTDRTTVYLRSNGNQRELDEESIDILDKIDILSVDLDIRPYDDTINGRPFRAAYLHSIRVTQDVDRFKASYEE